jgi:hypothetical protein
MNQMAKKKFRPIMRKKGVYIGGFLGAAASAALEAELEPAEAFFWSDMLHKATCGESLIMNGVHKNLSRR